ncbi:hypothetical protein ES703_64081 [subsurface metagenome]
MYSSVAELPEFRGTAWRAESGYSHARGTTVADIIRFEREELENEYPDISNELLRDLDHYSADDAVWVNRRRKDCLFYLSEGESEEAVGRVHLPEGSKIITPDYCGGYLVLRGLAEPMLKKGSNPVSNFLAEELIMPPPVGTCYEDAWRFLIKEEEGELIHGSVESLGRRIGHAWVELPTGYIWEPESGRFIKKADFQAMAKPQEEVRYSVDEAAIMLARVGKHGPWTEQERQMLKRGNPMPKTERERISFHKRIFGKGAIPPLERLGRGQIVNDLMPMAPDQGPPLPRALGIHWPWSKP